MSKPKSRKLAQDLTWVKRVSKYMDTKYSIAGFRFGWDPLLNLFPFLGKPVTFLISLFLVFVMWRNGTSGQLVMKMFKNVFVDAILGSIPLIGIFFDFTYRANLKNVKLLEEYYEEDKHQGTGIKYIIITLTILVLISIAAIVLMWKLSAWIFNFLF